MAFRGDIRYDAACIGAVHVEGEPIMAFEFRDSMVNDYITRGYLVLEGIIPPPLLRDLRVEAEKARELAHKLRGPQTQRIQPLSNYPDDLNLKPFYDYCDLPELRDAIERLLGPDYSHGHVDIMGLLVEPVDHPWTCGWHRDAVVEVPPAAYDDTVKAKLAEAWFDKRHFNQVNCALYADSCTWYVPGSHLRQYDLPGEIQSTGNPALKEGAEGLSDVEAERYYYAHCKAFPGAVQTHLAPGDFMVYRSIAWHTGNYLTYQPRATIHDIVRYNGEKSWSGWAETKQEAVKRLRERESGA